MKTKLSKTEIPHATIVLWPVSRSEYDRLIKGFSQLASLTGKQYAAKYHPGVKK